MEVAAEQEKGKAIERIYSGVGARKFRVAMEDEVERVQFQIINYSPKRLCALRFDQPVYILSETRQ